MIEYKSYASKVVDAIRDCENRALLKAGMLAKRDAKELAPVDTGFLRNSIDYDMGDREVAVGASAEYAPYVEFGTERQKAQPFLRPAVINGRREIMELFEQELRTLADE